MNTQTADESWEINPTSAWPWLAPLLEHFRQIPTADKVGEHQLRLGLGEFESGSIPPARWVARRAFLAAVFEVAPEAWDDLLMHVRPFLDDHDTDLSDVEVAQQWGILEDLVSRDASIRTAAVKRFRAPAGPDSEARRTALRAAQTKWARTWRLGDERHLALSRLAFLEAILHGRDGSSTQDEFPAALTATLTLLLVTPEKHLLPGLEENVQPEHWTISLQRWAPTLESWSDFAARSRENFERELAEHRRVLELAAEAEGLKRTTMKRDGLLHFRWLARFQVRRESISAIARSEHRGRPTVRDAIRHVAALIDLPLRTSQRRTSPRTGSDAAVTGN